MEFIEWLKVVLLGIVEGITEWLPISSTGHMILVNEIFPLKADADFMNDLFLGPVAVPHKGKKEREELFRKSK